MNKGTIPLEQINDNRIQTLMRNDVHNSKINDLATNHSDENLVIHNSQDQDVLCHRNNLDGWILQGVDYSIIQKGLLQTGLVFSGIHFLWALRVLILFDDSDSMMEALANDMYRWNKFYDEARLWIKSDCVVDRLAQVSLTNLPNIGWNVDCLSKILQGFRRIIGYDKINLKFSSMYTLRLLIGTTSVEELLLIYV